MSFQSHIAVHTVSWLFQQFKQDLLDTEVSIQRREVWDSERKSNLIISLLLDIPIESLLFEEKPNTVPMKYNVIDGKQRTLTICSFIDNDLAFSKKTRIQTYNGVDLIGKRFLDLPKDFQDSIMQKQISITVLRPLVNEDRSQLFFMRNQAVQLTSIELTRASIGENVLELLQSAVEHPFIQTVVKLTSVARKKFVDLQIILEYLMLKKNTNTGFSKYELSDFCSFINVNPNAIDIDEVVSILDYLYKGMNKKSKYLKKVNMPIVLCVAEEAKNRNIKPNLFAGWVEDLFGNRILENADYLSSIQSGINSSTKVKMRYNIIMDDAKKYLFPLG